MKNFEVGDRVVYFDESRTMSDPENGMEGTIVYVDRSLTMAISNVYLVRFDGFDGHSGFGKIDGTNGWWVNEHQIELVTLSVYPRKDFVEELSKEYLLKISKVNHDVTLTSIEKIKQIESLIANYNKEVKKFKDSQRPFKVGDILIGLDDKRYDITNSKSIVKVVDVLEPKYSEGYVVIVEVIAHSDINGTCYIGDRFNVFEKYFRKVIE